MFFINCHNWQMILRLAPCILPSSINDGDSPLFHSEEQPISSHKKPRDSTAGESSFTIRRGRNLSRSGPRCFPRGDLDHLSASQPCDPFPPLSASLRPHLFELLVLLLLLDSLVRFFRLPLFNLNFHTRRRHVLVVLSSPDFPGGASQSRLPSSSPPLQPTPPHAPSRGPLGVPLLLDLSAAFGSVLTVFVHPLIQRCMLVFSSCVLTVPCCAALSFLCVETCGQPVTPLTPTKKATLRTRERSRGLIATRYLVASAPVEGWKC